MQKELDLENNNKNVFIKKTFKLFDKQVRINANQYGYRKSIQANKEYMRNIKDIKN